MYVTPNGPRLCWEGGSHSLVDEPGHSLGSDLHGFGRLPPGTKSILSAGFCGLSADEVLPDLGTFDFAELQILSVGSKNRAAIVELLRLIERLEEIHT